jgi:hypothetical protein
MPTLVSSSQRGVTRGPAAHVTGTWRASSFRSGCQQGESSVMPTISTQNRHRVVQLFKRDRHEVCGSHHSRWQSGDYGRFQTMDLIEAGMLRSPYCQIDTGTPYLMQRIGSGIDHAGKQLDAFEFAERRRQKGALDRGAQTLVIDRPREATCQACRELFERHDLQAMIFPSCGIQTNFAHR